MELFRFAMLLLVQLSPIIFHANGEGDYMCDTVQRSSVTVISPNAKATKGCVMTDIGITFDIRAMYEAASKTPKNPNPYAVDIYISEAVFINSYINLINADDISYVSTRGPLLFKIVKGNIRGYTRVEFGAFGLPFYLPPSSRICIISSTLTISSSANRNFYTFILHGLQLVTNSSMEIAQNVIIMECSGCHILNLFYVRGKMKISSWSSFILRDNNITITAQRMEKIYERVWWQSKYSSLTVCKTSTYTWLSNIISLLAYDVTLIVQDIWYQEGTRPLIISQNSFYRWFMNTITMDGYNAYNFQEYIWFSYSHLKTVIEISDKSQILFYSNKMLQLARTITTLLTSNVFGVSKTTTIAISGGSTMVWRDNCIVFESKRFDKRHMFSGNWDITDGSDVLLDGNSITTNLKIGVNGSFRVTQLLLAPETNITIHNGQMTVRKTRVFSNNATLGATSSIVWDNLLLTSDTNVKQSDIKWSSSPAKDRNSPIPIWINSRLRHTYMCPRKPKPVLRNLTNPAPKSKSATAISSTIPAVLITSVVMLYLYNW